MGTNSSPLPPAGGSCATMKSEQNSISTLATLCKRFIARAVRRESLPAMQIRLWPLSPSRKGRTATTPIGCFVPATCTQASCLSMKSWSLARAVRVASSIRGRAPHWTYSLTVRPALPPAPHHPAALLREALSLHRPPSSFRPAGLSAGPAAGRAPALVPTLAPAAPPHTIGGAPSPARLTDAPPLGKSSFSSHFFLLNLNCSSPVQLKHGLMVAGHQA